MKTKNVYKLGICLAIAIFMILPTTIMANDLSPKDASDFQIQEPQYNEYEVLPTLRELTPLVDPEVTSMGVRFDGENVITPGEIVPYQDSFVLEGGTIVTQGCNPQVPPLIQGGMSIYSITEGVEVIMYETSFEDNFDIYNNWIQIDLDCGIPGGQYDSWTWSDARASDGDHSMKTTMYDIYKGNQDDLLQMRNTYDATGQYAVNFTFDVWVEGQDNQDQDGQYGIPGEWYDYVSFEIFDGASWVDINYNYFGMYFSDSTEKLFEYGWDITWFVDDLGNGWWHVWFEVPISWFSDPTQIAMGFDWHTDPQFQYEGGYIDNVKMISVEGVREKIFQTHLQECTEIGCDHTWTEYPLAWSNVEPGDYEIVYWVETENCPTAGTYDSNFPKPGLIIPFSIRDDYDCEITDLVIEDSFTHAIVPPEGRMNEGADAHIMFEYHQGGNIVGENIPVELHIYKKTWETDMSYDMESTMGWDPSLSYSNSFTDFDSFSGSKSLYFGNEDFMHIDDGFYGLKITGATIDFSEYEEVEANWYYNVAMPVAPNTYVMFCMFDPDSGYTLTSGASAMLGWSNGWVGPDNPRGIYHGGIDVMGMYEYFYSIGMFHDAWGQQVWTSPVGFRAQDWDYGGAYHEDGIVFNPNELDWSGCFIDDLTITGLKIGEEVFTDTMIIPGPVEPCETVNAQFEWEDVPFSRYRICVNTACEDDVDEDNNEMCQQIIVFDDLERLDKPESVDNTDGCNGEWGICGSDTDNYLSTNPNSETYASDANIGAYFDGCIDFSDLGLTIVDIPYPGILSEDFSGGVPPAGWVGPEFISYAGNLAGGTIPEADINAASLIGGGATLTSPMFDTSMLDICTVEYKQAVDWISGSFNVRLQADDGITGWVDVHLDTVTGDIPATTVTADLFSVISPSATTQLRFWINGVNNPGEFAYWVIDDVIVDGIDSAPDQVLVEFDAWVDIETGWDYMYFDVSDDCEPDQETDWQTVDYFQWYPTSAWSNEADGTYLVSSSYLGDEWWHYVFDISSFVTGDDYTVRFVLNSDASYQYRGILIDNFQATGFDDEDGPIIDTMDNMDNWNVDCIYIGDYWDTTAAPYCITIPFLPVDNALVWATEIEDAYEAWLTIDFDYHLSDTSCFVWDEDERFEAWLEISSDGGDTWFVLDEFTGVGVSTNVYDITYHAGNELLVRLTVFWNSEYPGDAAYAEICDPVNYFCINDAWITGKSDDTAPTSTATMSGTMKESGWYTTAVQVSISANDVGAGMGEIHYILDGSEKIVAGDQATFTVTGNGEHNIEYWAVDAMGNEEVHHTIPAFRIDSGSPPSVAITAPEPGLYLFGNKLLSASKVIIIGAFTVEATASDAESGIYRVQFYLDGDLISEDTEVPFSAYVAEKHMGAGTIKVVAEDYAQNTAEDTLDITYYKFL